MIKCSYCSKELDPTIVIMTEQGPACNDCAVKDEPALSQQTSSQEQPQQEGQPAGSPPPQENSQESPFDLKRAFRELQWVRFRQFAEGETDNVIMKRSLTELILMMDNELSRAKRCAISLHPESSTLEARFHMLSAVCYGLAFISTHPGPAQ